MTLELPLSLEYTADLRWGRSADSGLIVFASRKVVEVNDLCSMPSRNSATAQQAGVDEAQNEEGTIEIGAIY
jgi:hypothetical protein